MDLLSHRLTIFSNGEVTEAFDYLPAYHNEDQSTELFEHKLRTCAQDGNGCPAVMVVEDRANTVFTRDWQFYLAAINDGMAINNISNLMGTGTALMNRTGVNERRNYLTGENASAEDPKLDKLRTFSRNTHMLQYVNGQYRLITMNGNEPPPLKPGYSYPQSVEQIDPDAYLYHPSTHPHLFLVCNNVEAKPGNVSSVFPFAHGLVRPWLDNEIYSFFPLVSVREVFINPANWTIGQTAYPYRRVG